jgi:hypothetical protein
MTETQDLPDDGDRHDGRHGPPPIAAPGLVLFDGDESRFTVVSRPDGVRDGVDPLSELAVFAAASGCPRAIMCIPVRAVDVRDGDVISRPLLATILGLDPDGGVQLRARLYEPDRDGGLRPGGDLDPQISPVASMLYDALALCTPPLSVDHAAAVLRRWGHDVAGDGLREPHPATLSRDAYRVHKLARELMIRHRPTATAATASKRPAVPYGLPEGFVAASPI